MNQAEVIHAGWARRDPTNLSLLEACHTDVRDSTILDVELKAYADGAATGGTVLPMFSEDANNMYGKLIRPSNWQEKYSKVTLLMMV